VLVLPETITLAQASDTLGMLERAMRADDSPVLRLDASALKSFDTSAVAVLLECRRLAQAWGKGFELNGAPPKLGELAQLYGVDPQIGRASCRERVS
jgi:phospholipid transport system transporter-binding protein